MAAAGRSDTSGLLRLAMAILAGIALFLAIDRTVFGSALYFRWVAPTSGLGSMAQALERVAVGPQDRSAIVVMGDSRVGEGFSAELATLEARRLGSATNFVNAAVAGSPPRVWYYMLRRVFADGRKVAGVAIMLTSYHDNDPENTADWRPDIVFVHPLLSPGDIVDFPESFVSAPARIEAVEAIAFRGWFYKNDVQDFLRAPERRIRDVLAWRAYGPAWIAAYPGRDTSLAGLTWDLQTGQLSMPPGRNVPADASIAPYMAGLRQFGGRPPDNQVAVAYRQEWLGGIAELCRQAGATLYVFRIPRGPLHALADADDEPTGVVAELARAGRIVLLPAATFDDLERPEFFFDALHMNRAGRSLFSAGIAKAIRSAG